MLAIIATLFAVPSSQAASESSERGSSAAVVDGASYNAGHHETVGERQGRQPRSETCRSARTGLRFYRSREADWKRLRGVTQTPAGRRAPRSCPDARFLAAVAKRRSFAARQAYGRWLNARTLRDFRVTPDSNAWQKAVQETQRAYPGTRSWLLSCSASEGGWGRWVPNSEGSGVGGWLQYQPGTFSGFYNAARTHVTSRGFRVPSSAASWYSPLGQALAGGWAITHGMRHHWAGTGC